MSYRQKMAEPAGVSERFSTGTPVETKRRLAEGDAIVLPFELSAAFDGTDWKWSVSSVLSTVTDGTNGLNIDLSAAGFDTGTIIAATKWIVLQADIDGSLVDSNWTLLAVDLADAIEVGVTSGAQDKVRLLIGKITYVDDVATVTQHIFTAQRLAHGFLNTLLVRVFESAPVHADYA